MITKSDIMTALSRVIDPELRRSIVDLGMVRNVAVNDGVVKFVLALTIPECPLRDQLAETLNRRVAGPVLSRSG